MKNEKPAILLVEDQEVNRLIVRKLLSSEYRVEEADNGQSALDLLHKGETYATIVLDLIMPVMDGFTFLEEIKKTKHRDTPIVVMTGDHSSETEQKVLQMGAQDFVVKPIQPEILFRRIHNAIASSQMALMEQMRQMSCHDAVTGLYNRSEMFKRTKELLDEKTDITFAFVPIDIDRFRLYNSAMGDEEGDRVLRFIADEIEKYCGERENCIYGRIEGDVFCICEPENSEQLERKAAEVQERLDAFVKDYALKTSVGVYVIEDRSERVEAIMTKAAMASEKCKDQYSAFISYYDEEMSEKIEEEQAIINDMVRALENEEFVVYLQPKYELITETPNGAEALVRWVHPTKGLISPGAFIPVFERNGFIRNLDYYMWEHVCALLARWRNEGRTVSPISVNMSRVSLYNPKVVELLVDLITKYDIPADLLNLEVTESAYMSNPDLLKSIIFDLQSKGFAIMMDDFGSGYSSLNTLKEINVDILKIDMDFLPNGKDKGKGEKILSSIVRMAGWLGMPVIAEGVETVEQKIFLEGIGCGYVQGFYYAKPMPVSEYEELIEKSAGIESVEDSSARGNLAGAVWSSDPQIDEILKGISIPVAIYECGTDSIEVVRVNRTFLGEFGKDEKTQSYSALISQLDYENRQRVEHGFAVIHQMKEPVQVEFSYLTPEGDESWYLLKLHLLDQITSSSLVCGTYLDITAQKMAEYRFNTIVKGYQRSENKETMLIIDDQEVSRVILRGIFKNRFRILEAENGKEALELLEQHKDCISIILLDMIMPEGSGEEFLVYKNGHEEVKNIPVVVISSETEEELQKRMLELGVSDYITKPFVTEVTERRVNNVLEYNSRFRKMMEEYRKNEMRALGT